MNHVSKFVDLLLPRACFGCGATSARGSRVCEWCNQRLQYVCSPKCPVCASPQISDLAVDAICSDCLVEPRWIDRTTAAFVYDGPVADALIRAKWSGALCDWRSLCEQAAEYVEPFDDSWGVAVVPMHLRALSKRGFSTASIFADVIFPDRDRFGALSKVTGRDQRGRRRKERIESAKENYVIDPDIRAPGKVVIVDDVMTTGATVRAIARLLKKRGAKQVVACVVARDL